MTPIARDALTSALTDANKLFARLKVYLKKKELTENETEQLKALGKDIFLFDEQLHHKSYGTELLILTPLVHTLSMLAKSMQLKDGLGSLMITLSIAFLPGDEGTKLMGPSFEKYARELSNLFNQAFFQGISESEKAFFEKLTLAYLGISFSLGILALGVEKNEAMETASDEIKKRVSISKEIAMVYGSLFLQFALKMRFIETSIGESVLKPYGMELKDAPESVIANILEFAFLGSFIQGVAAQDKRKGEYLFKQLLGTLKERANGFQEFATVAIPSKLAATVTEMHFSLESEEMDLFIEALNGLIASFGIKKADFYKDLKDLHKLIGTLAFTISKEELMKVTARHTGSVQV